MKRTHVSRARIRGANAWVNRATDRLGVPIDRRIRPVVAALRAAGFRTTGSCEGHLARGEPSPWVDIGVGPVAADARKSRERRARNLRAQRKLLRLLDQFYSTRATEARTRIVLTPFGIEGGVRMTNQAAEIQDVEPKRRRARNLTAFRSEFDAFARFLQRQP